MQTISGDTHSSPFDSDGTYFKVANVVELEQRPFKVVTVEDRHVLLLLADGHIRALDSRCLHMGYPLSQGAVKDGVLRCHWHHWRFDLASGAVSQRGRRCGGVSTRKLSTITFEILLPLLFACQALLSFLSN